MKAIIITSTATMKTLKLYCIANATQKEQNVKSTSQNSNTLNDYNNYFVKEKKAELTISNLNIQEKTIVDTNLIRLRILYPGQKRRTFWT